MRGSIIILAFFTTGVAIGLLKIFPESILHSDQSQYALYLLMFLVGIGIGADPNSLKALRAFNLKILMVPLITIAGTTAGVALVWWAMGMGSFTDTLAVGYGFGYYSLSSIFITEARGETLGVVALLANIMREIVTLLGAPLMAIYFGKLAPIAAGGATSMDTTLPIISAASGKEFAIVSLFHGIVLTVLVPFLVTFVLSL
jgi:uncharacterized membrane protein YbjE (DUF340 family)